MKIRVEKTARIDCKTMRTIGAETRYNLYLTTADGVETKVAETKGTEQMAQLVAVYVSVGAEIDTVDGEVEEDD